MISPIRAKELQKEIDAATEAAKNDPALQAQVKEAVEAAQKATDAALAERRCGRGHTALLHDEFVKRGLIKP
jgi:hypothetical protein